jgi:hypothetical protein
VHFNAAESTRLAFARPVQDDFTIVLVYQSSQGLNTGTDFYDGAGLVNGEVANVVNDFGMSLNANGKLLAGTGNPDTTIVSTGSAFNNGQPHLVTFKRTMSTGDLELYVDGQLQGTATGGRQSLTAPAQLVLGAQQTLVYHFSGDIAEVKIFAGPLSDSYRIAEENSLKCKYGLAVDAPPFDYDADCDIDAYDLHVFVMCISGPNVPAVPNCLDKDLDNDGDVVRARCPSLRV